MRPASCHLLQEAGRGLRAGRRGGGSGVGGEVRAWGREHSCGGAWLLTDVGPSSQLWGLVLSPLPPKQSPGVSQGPLSRRVPSPLEGVAPGGPSVLPRPHTPGWTGLFPPTPSHPQACAVFLEGRAPPLHDDEAMTSSRNNWMEGRGQELAPHCRPACPELPEAHRGRVRLSVQPPTP